MHVFQSGLKLQNGQSYIETEWTLGDSLILEMHVWHAIDRIVVYVTLVPFDSTFVSILLGRNIC